MTPEIIASLKDIAANGSTSEAIILATAILAIAQPAEATSAASTS